MQKLVPELIPRPLWGNSALNALNKSTAWKAIRNDTLAKGTDAKHLLKSCAESGKIPALRKPCHFDCV